MDKPGSDVAAELKSKRGEEANFIWAPVAKIASNKMPSTVIVQYKHPQALLASISTVTSSLSLFLCKTSTQLTHTGIQLCSDNWNLQVFASIAISEALEEERKTIYPWRWAFVVWCMYWQLNNRPSTIIWKGKKICYVDFQMNTHFVLAKQHSGLLTLPLIALKRVPRKVYNEWKQNFE